MPYNVLKIFLVSVIVLYFYAAFHYNDTPTGELYPFFSWFVFTIVPSEFETEYTIRILEYDDKQMHPPVFFKDAYEEYFKKYLGIPRYNYMIQTLGESIEAGRAAEIQQRREALEKFFPPQHVVYEIVEVRFNTFKYWESGEFIEVESIAVFTSQNKTL